MDVIAATAFGFDAETQTDPDSPFLKYGISVVKDLEGSGSITNFITLLVACE